MDRLSSVTLKMSCNVYIGTVKWEMLPHVKTTYSKQDDLQT